MVVATELLVSLDPVYFQHINTGFPPIREIGENFEDFFQSRKSGKNGVFSQNQGTFFQTIFKPSKPIKPKSLRKMFLRLLNLRSCQEIALNKAIFAKTNVTKGTFKKNKYFFTKMSWWKLRKNQGELLGNQGIWRDKKSGNPVILMEWFSVPLNWAFFFSNNPVCK